MERGRAAAAALTWTLVALRATTLVMEEAMQAILMRWLEVLKVGCVCGEWRLVSDALAFECSGCADADDADSRPIESARLPARIGRFSTDFWYKTAQGRAVLCDGCILGRLRDECS